MLFPELYPNKQFPYGRWLLCQPSFFGVEYEINPWMKVDIKPVHLRAYFQWKQLHHSLIRLGAWVDYIEPREHRPDLVFTANAGLVRGQRVVLSRFRHPERQAEEPLFQEWFLREGYEVMPVTLGAFEGEGDALFSGRTLFAGFGFRTDSGVYDNICKFLEIKDIVMCELVDERFYHLDTCFCPLTPKLAMVFPDALSADTLKRIRKRMKLIEVRETDASKFVCNAVVLGRNVLIPSGSSNIEKRLKSHGFKPYPLALGEFMKAGGAAKCLSLRLV